MVGRAGRCPRSDRRILGMAEDGAPLPKLFIDVEPGVFISSGRIKNLARSFPNQHHVVLEGLHFVQEDRPDEIGRAIAGWLQRI